jgi:hypothetical protein
LRKLLLAAGAVLLLGSCDRLGQASYRTDLDMVELMAHVVDPAAFLIWNNSGSVVDETGERDRYPTPEGWKVIEDGAATVAEAGNLLKIPGRPRAPEAEWNRWSDLMTERAMAVMAAAEAQNKQGVFETGAALYQTCQGCHEKFIVEPMEANPAK